MFFFKLEGAYEVSAGLVGAELCLRDSASVVCRICFLHDTGGIFDAAQLSVQEVLQQRCIRFGD